MHSNYIIRTNDELICFYHSKENAIVCKKYKNGRWSGEETIVRGARDNFSVALKDNKIYLFSQDSQGNILLAQITEGAWNVKTVLENKTQKAHNVLLSPIITQNGFTIIYNSLSDDKTQYLVKQQLQPNGQWSPAARIDKIIEMSDQIYTLQSIANDHILLFYQTRTVESNIGYREMTSTEQGEYNVFHSTSNFISDTSFLTTNTAVHVLYIVKSMFSSQLIYRKKTNNQFSNPLVLYEGQRIDNCLITISFDNIYATFQVNSQLYICMSEDKGASFSRPAKYRKKFCLNPVKAAYITEQNQSENLLFIRDIYIDRSSPWDIQLVGDLYEDFYPRPVPEPQSKQEVPEPESKLLINQITAMQLQIDEKDKQLSNLSSMFAVRSEELARDAANVKRLYSAVVEENRALAERLAEITSKYESVLFENKTLIEQHQYNQNMRSSINENTTVDDVFDEKELTET